MRRELNEIEYFNWTFGQPYNMVVVVRIRGDLRPDRLRAALERAQRRHPLLGVNTEIGPDGLPWFSSDGVGAIPLTVVEGAGPDDAEDLVESGLATTFPMDAPGASRLPLIRVTLLLPSDPARPADVVFTVQHIIADGLSMVFLVRDLLAFMEEPDAPVEVLDAPASPEDLLPARVRRRIPTSSLRFRVALWFARLYARLRFGGRSVPATPHVLHQRVWELTPEQTDRLRARARREGVSVQSAVCTALLPGFDSLHNPVSLRARLGRAVGESVGLFVGAAWVRMRYRPARGFWGNARRYHRRLRRAMRNPFRIFLLFSKAVPVALIREMGPLLVKLTGTVRPLAVTNLGVLDGKGIRLGAGRLAIESFFGATTNVIDSSVLTLYTVDGRMRLHVLANEEAPAGTAVRDDADRAVQRLLEAIA